MKEQNRSHNRHERRKPSLRSSAELAGLLGRHQIDLGRWNQGAAKGVAELWEEILAGETTLQLHPLRRQVSVVSLVLRRGPAYLLEIGQELADGRLRTRQQHPSEKIIAGESPLAAAYRCLREELRLDLGEVFFDSADPEIVREKRISRSYPGLPTIYWVHIFAGIAPTLPDGQFTTLERGGDAAAVRTHRWAWVQPDRESHDCSRSPQFSYFPRF